MFQGSPVSIAVKFHPVRIFYECWTFYCFVFQTPFVMFVRSTLIVWNQFFKISDLIGHVTGSFIGATKLSKRYFKVNISSLLGLTGFHRFDLFNMSNLPGLTGFHRFYLLSICFEPKPGSELGYDSWFNWLVHSGGQNVKRVAALSFRSQFCIIC